jgi:N-sulfoglucosamine sulfohydrolase
MPHGLAHIYDAGTRVPLAIVWPGKIAPGSQSNTLVSYEDLAPTLLAATGTPAPGPFTGRSLLPLLLGQPDPQARPAIFLERERHADVRAEHLGYPVRAVRTADYLFVRNFHPDRWPSGDPVMRFAVGEFGDTDFSFTKQLILDQRATPALAPYFELLFGKRPAEELYDLRTDPDQTQNLATDPTHAAARTALAQQLSTWMQNTADPRATKPDDNRWDKFPYFGKAGPGRKPKSTPTK